MMGPGCVAATAMALAASIALPPPSPITASAAKSRAYAPASSISAPFGLCGDLVEDLAVDAARFEQAQYPIRNARAAHRLPPRRQQDSSLAAEASNDLLNAAHSELDGHRKSQRPHIGHVHPPLVPKRATRLQPDRISSKFQGRIAHGKEVLQSRESRSSSVRSGRSCVRFSDSVARVRAYCQACGARWPPPARAPW